MSSYFQINKKVMEDTVRKCQSVTALKDAIAASISNQIMIEHEKDISQPRKNDASTKYVVSNKRSYEAAKNYAGKRIAVLNFANNHSVGGSPFESGAQEESLCRCSTLYSCLCEMRDQYYDAHKRLFDQGVLNIMGNDDLIYTPEVVVFKTDERTNPIYPEMMSEENWYKVNVITCAAPEIRHTNYYPSNYEEIITSRCKKILDVAAMQKDEVLILGAWGCGAFGNKPEIVAKAFHKLLKNYAFEVVEFAMSSANGFGNSPFVREFRNELTFELVNAPNPENAISKTVPSGYSLDYKEELQRQGLKDCKNFAKLYNRRYSGYIRAPIRDNEVFVFSSYSTGNKRMGTAKQAMDYFQAHPSVVNGPTGKSYAIPSEISLERMQEVVNTFAEYAKNHSNLDFLVTPIGVGGIFKRDVKEMARLFKCCLPIENVFLPKVFVEVLEGETPICDKVLQKENDMIETFKKETYHELNDECIDYAALAAEKDDEGQMYIRPHSIPQFTPEYIESLQSDQVFVFGSNLQGLHGAGAARMAHTNFGAEWGVGVGPMGQCYAIPTMQGGVNAIKPYVDDFIEYAKKHTDNTFLVTRIGCNIAGFKDSDIAPLFEKAMYLPNVRLPRSFAVINIVLENMRSSIADFLQQQQSFEYGEFEEDDMVHIISTDHSYSFSLLKRSDKCGLFEYEHGALCYGSLPIGYVSVGEPFAYDEVKFCNLNPSMVEDCGYCGYIALKQKEKWFVLSLDNCGFQLMTVGNTFDEACVKLVTLTGVDLINWYDPFVLKAKRDEELANG